MRQTLTLKKLKTLSPCSDKYLDMFGEHESLNIEQAFDAGFTVSDICWLMGVLDKREEIIAFASFCAKQIKGDSGDAYVKSAINWASAGYANTAARSAATAAAIASATSPDLADVGAAIRKEQKKFLMELLK